MPEMLSIKQFPFESLKQLLSFCIDVDKVGATHKQFTAAWKQVKENDRENAKV